MSVCKQTIKKTFKFTTQPFTEEKTQKEMVCSFEIGILPPAGPKSHTYARVQVRMEDEKLPDHHFVYFYLLL